MTIGRSITPQSAIFFTSRYLVKVSNTGRCCWSCNTGAGSKARLVCCTVGVATLQKVLKHGLYVAPLEWQHFARVLSQRVYLICAMG
jgi:hypothetical protein